MNRQACGSWSRSQGSAALQLRPRRIDPRRATPAVPGLPSPKLPWTRPSAPSRSACRRRREEAVADATACAYARDALAAGEGGHQRQRRAWQVEFVTRADTARNVCPGRTKGPEARPPRSRRRDRRRPRACARPWCPRRPRAGPRRGRRSRRRRSPAARRTPRGRCGGARRRRRARVGTCPARRGA
jgi:hypothetical protein